MSKIVKIAMLLVALTATISFAGGYAFRAGFSLYTSEDSKMDEMAGICDGYSYGGGLVTIVTLNSKLSFVSEFSFLYRKPMILGDVEDGHIYEEYLTEFAMSIPIMFQLTLAEGIPYLAAGVQLDSPISPKITSEIDDKVEKSRDANGRKSPDFGILLGLGYLITPNIGLDARAVIGLTSLFEKLDNTFLFERLDDSRWNQYGAGLTYYF